MSNTKQKILNLPEAEKRERAKQQLYDYLTSSVALHHGIDDDLETIMNICQGGSDAGRALSELQGEFNMLLDIMRNMRTHQQKFYAAKPGTLDRTYALRESKRYEAQADRFLKEQDEAANAKPEPLTLF